MASRRAACHSHGRSDLGLCLTVTDPMSILSLLRAVKQIRSRIQSVPKNDRVDDFATIHATQPRDPDLTRIVLKV